MSTDRSTTELSTTAGPATLIPGDPEALEELGHTLGLLARGMGEGQARLAAIHSGSWQGHGGNAFRGAINIQPGRFGTASDAFGQARGAIVRHAEVLRQAQSDAAAAQGRYGRGEQATSSWHGTELAGRKPDGPDPGDADRAAATRLLADARGRVDASARHTACVLAAAENGAPKKPGRLHRAISGMTHLVTGGAALGRTLIDVGTGIADGVVDVAKGTWALTGALCTDPAAFARSWEGLLAVGGLPRQRQAFARSFVDWDEWASDPARAFGHTGVNVGGILLGTAGIFARAGSAAEAVVPPAADLSPEMVAVTRATQADPAVIDGSPAWRGLTPHAKLAQKSYGEEFSRTGTFGQRTVDGVVLDLKSGVLHPTDLPIDIIRRGDNTLILNTRSSQALAKAGISRSQWIVKDVTGEAGPESRLNAQLRRNRLTEDGTPTVRPSREKPLGNALPVPAPHDAPPENGPLIDGREFGLAGPGAEHIGAGRVRCN